MFHSKGIQVFVLKICSIIIYITAYWKLVSIVL